MRAKWVVSVPLLLSLSCGATPATDASIHVTPSASAVASTATPLPLTPVYPHDVIDLATAIPKDAALAIGIPAPSGGASLGMIQSLAASVEVAKLTHLPERELKSAIDAFDGADFFVVAAPSDGDRALSAGVVRFREKAPVEALFSAAKLKQVDAIHWSRVGEGGKSLEVAWLSDARVAVIAFDGRSVDAALDTLLGKNESITASTIYRAPTAGAGWLIADLARLAPGVDDLMGPGSRIAIEAGADTATVSYAEYGAGVPRLGAVLGPSAHEQLPKLPTGALVAMDVSLARRPGKTLRDVLNELGRPSSSDAASAADLFLKSMTHMGLDEVDGALGDDVAIAVYMNKQSKAAPEKRFSESGVLLGSIATRDDKVARMLVDALARAFKAKKGVTSSPGKLNADQGDSFLRIEAQKGAVVVAVGAKKATLDALASIAAGKTPLGASPSFAEYKRRVPTPKSHLSLYADVSSIMAILDPGVAPENGPLKDVLAKSSIITTDVTLAPSDKGLELTLHGDGSLGIVGMASSIGVYGVRRYLQESKVAEAKNTLGAIARGAVASYERELPSQTPTKPLHSLCRSAVAVPTEVSRGGKHAPSQEKGKDFDTGDDQSGWRCLRFSMDTPFYYRYDYRQGGGYKGPARGGPNPGPNGFEASAEGDLDGNGKTSLFTLTGKIKANGTIEVAPDLFISDELE